jgi:hypothetical protein
MSHVSSLLGYYNNAKVTKKNVINLNYLSSSPRLFVFRFLKAWKRNNIKIKWALKENFRFNLFF